MAWPELFNLLNGRWVAWLELFVESYEACGLLTTGAVGVMSASLILSGTFVLGLSFGSFFTLIVPVVNEMYGQRHFGVIMGSQLGSQALASFATCASLYTGAEVAKKICYFRIFCNPSFFEPILIKINFSETDEF